MNVELNLPSGSTGTSHDTTSPRGTGFAPQIPLFLSYELIVTRASGTQTGTLRTELRWYNAAGGNVGTFQDDLVIDASVSTLRKWPVTPPAGAVSVEGYIKYTPQASPTQHTIKVQQFRLGKTELQATNGAAWGSNLTGIPANLAALVGSEVINNQAILDSIANDDVIAIPEKIGKLIPMFADMEARYQDLRARAVALGISVTTLDGLRNNYRNTLASFNPAWNDTSQDTTIYTPRFPDKNFPTGWGTGGTTSTSVANGWINVTDGANTYAQYTRSISRDSGQFVYAAGVVVQKQASAAGYSTLLRLHADGDPLGTKYVDILLNPGNGATGLLNPNPGYGWGGNDYGEVYDLGDCYFMWCQIEAGGSSTGITLDFYPCAGNATATSYDPNPTGNINIKVPVFCKSYATNLGHYHLQGRLAAYSKEITKVAAQISGIDSQTTNYIKDTATNTLFNYDYLGNPVDLAGGVSRDILFKLMDPTGNQITSGYNWTVRIVSGKWNNTAAGATLYGMGIDGSGNAYFTVGSLENDSVYEVTATSASNGNIVFRKQGTLTRKLAAAPTGGGGSGSATDFNFTSFLTNPTLTSTPLDITAGGSDPTKTPTTVSATISIIPAGNGNGSWSTRLQIYKKVSGLWQAQGSAQVGSADKLVGEPAEGDTLTHTLTGLSATAAYAPFCWITTGSRAMSCTGQFVGTH